MARPSLTVLPVFFVPSDEVGPTPLQQTTLMRHLYWAQQRYLAMFSGRTTFQIGADRPQVFQGKNPTSYYVQQPQDVYVYVEEWLAANNYTRYNCPYSLLIFFMSSKNRYPYPSGGRPINGWLNEGGGIGLFSSQDLDQFNFQSTLRHELGHTFGLVHADANGYDMATNASIMSYNTSQWSNFFQDSPTPGILIPEDLRSLGQNKLAFPFYSFTTADIPSGYRINPTIIILPPMRLLNEPDYLAPNQYLSANTVSQSVKATGTAEFTASFPTSGGGSPTGFSPTTYQWQRNGIPVAGATAATLSINNAGNGDAGTYRVLATNGATSFLSNAAILTVTPLINPSSAAFTPQAATVGLSGGEGTVSVSLSPANANWTVSSNSDWLTVPSGKSGSGTWTLMYSVAPNPLATTRAAQLSLAGAVFTVTQGPGGAAIATSPSGLQFGVDGGTAMTAPQTLNLAPGSHTIAVVTPQAGGPGTQYVFTSWSDGGAASHPITVTAIPALYTATFKTQYQLTLSAAGLAGGTVSPSGRSFYDAAGVVPISAIANPGYSFAGWTGNVANANLASTIVTMNGPQTVTANFVSSGPSINPGGIVPLFSSVPVIEAGSWISIYGNNLADVPTEWMGDYPTMLGGVTVAVNGKLGYLWSVSPGQINVQAPDDSTLGMVNVVVTTPRGSASSNVILAPLAPSLNLFDTKHVAGVISTPDGTGAYGNGSYDLLGPAGQFVFKTRPVRPGEILVLYGVGFGLQSRHLAFQRPCCMQA